MQQLIAKQPVTECIVRLAIVRWLTMKNRPSQKMEKCKQQESVREVFPDFQNRQLREKGDLLTVEEKKAKKQGNQTHTENITFENTASLI